MIKSGMVVKVENDRPLVCFERAGACEKCNGCMDGKKMMTVSVLGNAKEGDYVDVELPGSKLVISSFVMYTIPLFGLVIGIMLGNHFTGNELHSLFYGLGGLFVCGLFIKLFDNWMKKQTAWQPHIVAVHPRESSSAVQTK